MNPYEIPPREEDPTTRARRIAQNRELFQSSGELKVFQILEELKKEHLLEAEVARVKKRFALEMGDFSDRFGEDCWEMLTALELFDEETAEHCVNTYLIAKEKVEKKLWNGLVLAEKFKGEGVELDEFYRACLLHDIGKIEVPHSVLVNRTTDEACASLLMEHQEDVLLPRLKSHLKKEDYALPKDIETPAHLLVYLHDTLHTRPQALAPIKLLLDQPIDEKIITELARCECSPEDSLLDIMRTHDRYSKQALAKRGRTIEGVLAGAHHRYTEEDAPHQTTISTLRVSTTLADFLHLADVQQAMLSKRHYKEERTLLDAQKILAIHVKQELIKDESLAYLWIADTMNSVRGEDLNENDEKNFSFLATFLDEEKTRHPAWPDWKVNYTSLKKAA